MEPKVGQIVEYYIANHDFSELLANNNTSKTCPAIITCVFTPECVNLKIIPDGEGLFWRTSVPNKAKEGDSCWTYIE